MFAIREVLLSSCYKININVTSVLSPALPRRLTLAYLLPMVESCKRSL